MNRLQQVIGILSFLAMIVMLVALGWLVWRSFNPALGRIETNLGRIETKVDGLTTTVREVKTLLVFPVGHPDAGKSATLLTAESLVQQGALLDGVGTKLEVMGTKIDALDKTSGRTGRIVREALSRKAKCLPTEEDCVDGYRWVGVKPVTTQQFFQGLAVVSGKLTVQGAKLDVVLEKLVDPAVDSAPPAEGNAPVDATPGPGASVEGAPCLRVGLGAIPPTDGPCVPGAQP